MEEGSEAGVPEHGSGTNPASAFESTGGRLRFTVDLRPGETTIVSWKRLLKDANSRNSKRPESSMVSSEAQRSFVSKPPSPLASSSKQTTENEPHDSQAQAGTNRLSTVIERIERMYAGDGSSDEEDLVLDNVPDDDEYDTEDSFIDDTELNDYFQVDNSAIKHDGFFVNRGKLDRTEPIINANQKPKKRRRNDLSKSGGSDDGHNPNKIRKMVNKGKMASTSIQRNSTSPSNKEAAAAIHMPVQGPPENVAEVSLKKTAGIQVAVNTSGLLNGGVIRQDIDINQHRPGGLPANNHTDKMIESELQDASAQRSNAKNSNKAALIQRKDRPSVRPKSTILEKAIRELEEIVAEFRPPSAEAQDPDNASQAVKRRLPPEIKQKLAKVARIAQASYGKVPKDVTNHLMSIVGHLMHITTLKRNLKAMANMGLSAKKEKEDRVQKIKQEVSEMVKLQILHVKSKLEQHGANSDDFQEAGPEEKEALKHKYSMDDILENKICDLYDLYIERLEEDSGPPVRRLYEELALLWPSGVMHTDGIKRAIYRAKDRKGLCSHRKDREKIKKKKLLAPKAENTVDISQASHIHDQSLSGSPDQHPPFTINSIPNAAAEHVAARPPKSSSNRPNHDKPRQEKMKGSSIPNSIDAMPLNMLKKKVKRKLNSGVAETQPGPEKLAVSSEEKRLKTHKHSADKVSLSKSNPQPALPSGQVDSTAQ